MKMNRGTAKRKVQNCAKDYDKDLGNYLTSVLSFFVNKIVTAGEPVFQHCCFGVHKDLGKYI